MSHRCSFIVETLEFANFIKCLTSSIKFVQFSCTNNKIVLGGINNLQTLSMFLQIIPIKFESTFEKFDIIVPISTITHIFNVYRYAKESNETLQITLNSDSYSYNIEFLEKMSNKGNKYNVKSCILEKHLNNTIMNIIGQKLPNFLRKIKCPTQILSKILGNMCEEYTNVTLICTKSSLIVQNDRYSVEILDETIVTSVDEDSYIKLNINDLIKILETSTSKYIDMYFTGENLLAMSNQKEEQLYTFYMQCVQ